MEVDETPLPGIGRRRDFSTREGRRIGVVSHYNGRRELIVYDAHDPDSAADSITLTPQESEVLAELLGTPHVVEKRADIDTPFPGLVAAQVKVLPGSPYVGRTLADTQARTRSGASIVAVIRDGQVLASPRPDFTFEAEDVVVVVGTPEDTAAVSQILRGD